MTPKLDIASLADGIPVIDEEVVAFYKLNCMACFHLCQNDYNTVDRRIKEKLKRLYCTWA